MIDLHYLHQRGFTVPNKGEIIQKISVIIPVYNVQDYLKKCLNSICKQTYKDLEIICVEDCSTDESPEILRECAKEDKRIRIVQHYENRGLSEARQSGIDIAEGDYIAFVDSDDWVDKDFYEKMLEEAVKNQTDIVVNNTIMDHVEDRMNLHIFPGHNSLMRMVYTKPYLFIDKFFCVVWNKLYKAEFLKGRRYTIPQKKLHEDIFFHYTTFAFAKNVSFFDGPAYHYVHRLASISNSKHDWGVEHIKAYSEIYDFYRDNSLLNKKIKLYSTMPFFIIRNEEMFGEYKDYFTKVQDYFIQNKEIFNDLDLFFARAICECENYTEYTSKYPSGILVNFLRRKINK